MEEKSTPASRSIAAIGIVVVLVVLSVAMPSSWFAPKQKEEGSKWKIDVSKIKSKKAIAEDTNADGQVTWSEVISETLHTDEQTKENLKHEQVDMKAIEELNNENNLTASFSKNLYLSASYLDQNNMTDEASQKAMAAKLMAQEAIKIKPTIYTYRDIKVAKSETKNSIKAYGNTIEPILDGLITKKIITDEVTALDAFSKNKDAATQAAIVFATNKNKLDIAVKKLEALEIPPSALIYHTEMLNKVAAYRDMITNISTMDTDPLRASLVMPNYITVSRGVMSVFESYSNYFNIQNVSYSKNEPGYVFTIGYTLH